MTQAPQSAIAQLFNAAGEPTKADEIAERLQIAMKAESFLRYKPPKLGLNNRGVPCSVDWCPNVAYAKGLCNAHYIRARAGRPLDEPLHSRSNGVSCTECGKKLNGKGAWSLCQTHYRIRRREIIQSICRDALGGVCARCGVSYPDCVYDYHHVDPSTKDGGVSAMIDGSSLEEIGAEVAKCELLCANCHRIEHHGRDKSITIH